jgi:ABC-type amino acid transport substrate-binding protein
MDFSDPYIINSQAILMRVEDEGLTVDDFKSKARNFRPRPHDGRRLPKALSARTTSLPMTASALP